MTLGHHQCHRLTQCGLFGIPVSLLGHLHVASDVRMATTAPTYLVKGTASGARNERTREMLELTTRADRRTTETRRLLACGIVAGPLFLVVSLVQAFTREGFDLGRHPISLLSLGDLGWLQISNFVVTGAMYLACAIGLRRVLQSGRGTTWGPRLVGALGVGLIAAGLFITDAGAGYPPGASAGAPLEISWHGFLHEIGFMVAIFGMIGGCLVLARRFAALSQPVWVALSVATPVAVLGLSFWPDLNGLSVRLVIATAILFGYVAAVAARALQELQDTPLAQR
jgi:Protein of unknown function (DUF998)